jgi:hypothetical protein
MDGPSPGLCNGALQDRDGYMSLATSLSLILTGHSRLQRSMGEFTKAVVASSYGEYPAGLQSSHPNS